jgi:hypothetical protein
VDYPDNRTSNPRTFWDWFLLGALAGVVYSLFRNPAGCACCVGCMAVALALAILVAVIFVLEHVLVVAVAIIVAFALWRVRLRSRAS